MLVVASTAVLSGLYLLAKGGELSILVASVIIALLCGVLVPALVRFRDRKSIVSTRRYLGLLFVSNLVWTFPLILGIIASLAKVHAVTSEFTFGAFLAWGFQFVVINAAFTRNVGEGLLLSCIQPLPILLITTWNHLDFVAMLFGVLGLALLVFFMSRISSIRTKTGVASFDMLRAFLKTWVGSEPSDLEGYFAAYAKPEQVRTDVLLARTERGEVALIIPGLHPGPFSPVGSYNLSELIFREVGSEKMAAVVLHGTGGHERNAPRNEVTVSYAKQVSDLIHTQKPGGIPTMRGPVRSRVGITNLTALGFGKEILTIVTNAPYRSDDVDPQMVTAASTAAADLGLDALTVDAHNSVNGEEVQQTEITQGDWERFFSDVMASKETEFSLGAANSLEVGFKAEKDVSDGGISVVVFSSGEGKSALVSADSNNAISGLRERLGAEMKTQGVELIDLCTSDTHKLAARNLTRRGYFALGEYTDQDKIVDVVKRLSSLAIERLQPCRMQVVKLESEVPLIGSDSLDDLAAVTQSAISASRNLIKVLAPVFAALLAITLFY